MIVTITKSELKDVLMEPKAPGVKEAYHIIRGEAGQDVTVITAGKNGNEFNKTYGYFYTYPGVKIIHIIYGAGIIVLQRNAVPADRLHNVLVGDRQDSEIEAKEVRIIRLRAGMNIEIPAGYGHCLVNIGKAYLVVIGDSIDEKYSDVSSLKAKRGLVYYIVDRRGDVGFEPNPNYQIHPQITIV